MFLELLISIMTFLKGFGGYEVVEEDFVGRFYCCFSGLCFCWIDGV